MISEALDFRYLLLENYKKLKLNESELAVIFMIDHLIGQSNPFVTADLLSLRMSMDVSEIDKILATLLTRGFIEYIAQGKKTITTLNPLKKVLYRQFEINMRKEEDEGEKEKTASTLHNIYKEFETLLKRPLAPVELSKIREWVSYGYSDELIINGLKEILKKGKKSLRALDKLLLSWATRDERENEGVFVPNEEWSRNLAETIRIAKTPWLDDDDD